MSKITLEPNSSGAGTFSIVSPDSNTNRTLNLPDNAGKFLLTDLNDNLTVSGTTDLNDILNVAEQSNIGSNVNEGNNIITLSKGLSFGRIATGKSEDGNRSNILVDLNGADFVGSGLLVLRAGGPTGDGVEGGTASSYQSQAVYWYNWSRINDGDSQLTTISRNHYGFDGNIRVQVSLTEASNFDRPQFGRVNFVINSWATRDGVWNLWFMPIGF